jgi:asparagine synthase (glutamine-hydrolysing)
MERSHFWPLPGADQSALDFERELSHALKSRGNRVLLSGIGGDEVLGGVPTPIPELADLIAARRWRTFARQIKNWSLVKRRPWMHFLYETLREFMSPKIAVKPEKNRIAPWLDYSFVHRHEPLFLGGGSRLHFFGVRPSFQVNLAAFDSLKREIACAIPSPVGCYTRSYPYLDRNLLEFLYSIPREQLVRPGRRRSLMRRALTNVLPPEILERKRKAFVVRGPMVGATTAFPSLTRLCSNMLVAYFGFVDPGRLLDTFTRLGHGQEENIIMLMRVVKLELWLQDLSERKIIQAADQSATNRRTHLLSDLYPQSFGAG